MTSKTFDRVLVPAVTGGLLLLGAVMWQMSPARGHDHSRPDLTNWFMSLHSKHAGMCCDGSDAMHLNNVEDDAERFVASLPGQNPGQRKCL